MSGTTIILPPMRPRPEPPTAVVPAAWTGDSQPAMVSRPTSMASASATGSSQPCAQPTTATAQEQPDLAGHLLSSAAALAAVVFHIAVAQSVRPGRPVCSRVSDASTDACRCDDHNWPSSHRLWFTAVWLPPLVAITVMHFLQHRAAMGPAARPRRALALVVVFPALFYATNAVWDQRALQSLLSLLSLLLGVALWPARGRVRQSLRAAVPHLAILPGSVIWNVVFINSLPELVGANPDLVAHILSAQTLLLSAFSVLFVRAMLPFLRDWPLRTQAQLVRAELQRMSGAHIAMTLGTVTFKGYRFADLHAGHPIAVSLYLYIAAQLAMRCHLISFAVGRLRGRSWAAISAARRPVLGTWGTCKDARFWAYVPALVLRLVPRGEETEWTYSCDGSFADLGETQWVLLLLAGDVLLELLYVGVQRWLRGRFGDAHPFRSPWVVGNRMETAVLVYSQTTVAWVGQVLLAWTVGRL